MSAPRNLSSAPLTTRRSESRSGPFLSRAMPTRAHELDWGQYKSTALKWVDIQYRVTPPVDYGSGEFWQLVGCYSAVVSYCPGRMVEHLNMSMGDFYRPDVSPWSFKKSFKNINKKFPEVHSIWVPGGAVGAARLGVAVAQRRRPLLAVLALEEPVGMLGCWMILNLLVLLSTHQWHPTYLTRYSV